MKKNTLLVILTAVSFSVTANPGQFQINQACIDVGCFSGDNPATKTVEITRESGTFILTSDLTFTDSDNGSPAILVNNANNRSSVVIDLNGFKIRHNGIADSSTHGIIIQGQNSVVTLKNGKIAAFFDGLRAEGGASVVIENMTFRISRDDAIEAGKGIIRNNVFDANDFAINSTNASGSISGDRLLVSNNIFIDDAGDQDAVFGFSTSNYCRDNVIAYDDGSQFGSCTLAGDNLCDNALCSVVLSVNDGAKE